LDFSNFDAMIIEIVLAGGAAAGLAIWLHIKSQNKQEIDVLENKLRDLEHKLEIMRLEKQTKDLQNLNKKQEDMIERLEPLIIEQGKIIEKQEKQRKDFLERVLTSLDKQSQFAYIKIKKLKSIPITTKSPKLV